MAQDRPSAEDVGSVTRWLSGLKRGDRQATQALWERYFEPMVRVAERRLRGTPCRVDSAQDVAVDAFLSFCRNAQREGHFPDLHGRDNLVRLLVRFTSFKAYDVYAREVRRRRIVRGESALGEAGFEPHAGRERPPEFETQLAGLLAKLPEELKLREIAVMRMEGWSNNEIAAECELSRATVERRLRVIRGRLKADWDVLRGNEPEGSSAN
jgi:DNA-directed RNA polymerase specialized sigma24 family protein